MAIKETFSLIDSFPGFVTKPDVSKTPAGFLVQGSQNVFLNDQDKIVKAPGYTLDGAAGDIEGGISSSYTWNTHKNLTLPVRAFAGATPGTGKLQVRYIKTGSSAPIWYDIMTGLTDLPVSYTTWWDLNGESDYLIWCYGTVNMSYWKGAVQEIVSNTSTVITVASTAEFPNSGNVIVAGVSYSYTAKTATTLTGLSGLPTFTVGDPMFSGVLPLVNYPTATFKATVVYTVNNHIWVESDTSQDINVTQGSSGGAGSMPNFTYTSPVRKPGEGNKFTVDSVGKGVISDDDNIYVSAGRNEWYQITKILTADGTGENFKIKKLRTGELQGAISQDAIAGTKYGIAIITKEKTIDTLANIATTDSGSVQGVAISDPISNLLEEYNFDGGVDLKYFKNFLLAAIPSEGVVLFYDMVKKFWQPVYTAPVRKLEVIDGELYGHSSVTNETYKLLTGLNFNGAVISAVARFGYLTYGYRSNNKVFEEYYLETYLNNQAELNMILKYEYEGSAAQKELTIVGTGADDVYKIGMVDDGSLGKYPLGARPLGGGGEESTLAKYRKIFQTNAEVFYEMQVEFREETIDGYFEVLSHGPRIELSEVNNQAIKD